MSIQINDRITLKNNIHGVIRYIGPVNGRNEEWVGIELDEAKGSNDGTVNGRRYFYCQDKHGLFVKYEKLTRKMKSVDESLGLSHSIMSNILDEESSRLPKGKNSMIFEDNPIESNTIDRNDVSKLLEDTNDASKLLEENRTYKELLETVVRRYSEALTSIKENLKILQNKIENIKIKQRPTTEKDKVRRIALEMIEANNRGDKKRFNELYEVFKITMEKYQIKIE